MLLGEPLYPFQPPPWWTVLGTLSGHCKFLGGYMGSVGGSDRDENALGGIVMKGSFLRVKCALRAKHSRAQQTVSKRGPQNCWFWAAVKKGWVLWSPSFVPKILSMLRELRASLDQCVEDIKGRCRCSTESHRVVMLFFGHSRGFRSGQFLFFWKMGAQKKRFCGPRGCRERWQWVTQISLPCNRENFSMQQRQQLQPTWTLWKLAV